jgi:hypothetical protein
MSKVQSKRVNAFKTFALIIAIGIGHLLQSGPVHAEITAETPALLIGQE